MARLTDPEILARYKQALSEWAVYGAVVLEGRGAHNGLRTTLPGVSVDEFKATLHRFVCEENGEIDQVKEHREPWREKWEWRYDLRLTINGVAIYLETRLHPESPTSTADPSILIVQVKPL